MKKLIAIMAVAFLGFGYAGYAHEGGIHTKPDCSACCTQGKDAHCCAKCKDDKHCAPCCEKRQDATKK